MAFSTKDNTMKKTFTVTVDFPDNPSGEEHYPADLREYVITAIECFAVEAGCARQFNYNNPEVTYILMRDE